MVRFQGEVLGFLIELGSLASGWVNEKKKKKTRESKVKGQKKREGEIVPSPPASH